MQDSDHTYHEDDDIRRQLEELESEYSRESSPTPDLKQRRRGLGKPVIFVALAIVLAVGGFFGWSALSSDEPPPLEFTFEEPEPPGSLSSHVAENRTALNDNVNHINQVSQDLAATQEQLQQLIVSLQQLDPYQMHLNQEDIIVKVKELDSRQREIEEQIRQSFQINADTGQINDRLSQLIANHNTLVADITDAKTSLHQLQLDTQYLNDRLEESQQQGPTHPVTEADLIQQLAQCRSNELPLPPVPGGQVQLDITDQLVAQYTEQLQNGEISVFIIEERLAECLNPSST